MVVWMAVVFIGSLWLMKKDIQEAGPPVDHSNGTCGCHFLDDDDE